MPIPLIAAAILAVASVASGKKGADKKKQASRIEQEAIRLQNVRARIQAMKEFRIARANALVGITSSGTDIRSSSYQGIKGSLQSQIKENAEFSFEQEEFGEKINKANEKAAKFQFIAGALQMGASVAAGAGPIAKGSATPAPTNTNLNPSPFIFNSNK